MTTEYIAYPWPEYQEYMGKEWFRKECYYCADKDVYFIPKNRVNTTSTDNGLCIMKELTVKEKANAYNKALERAKEKYPACYSPVLLEYIFPELKESEDKEIRKDIIRNLKRYINCIKDGYDTFSAKNLVIKEVEKQIAWLEKQGEQKPTLPKWKYKNDNTPLLKDSLILNKYGCVAKSPSGAIVSDVWVIDYDELAKLPKEELEKQSEQETLCDKCRKEHPSHSCQDITELGRCSVEHEQKSDNSYCQENCKGFQETGKCFADGDCKAKREAESNNKFKPKFKVGDWISNDMCDVHIASIEDGMYYFDEGDGLSIVFVDEHYHLWTIEDAIDGDILAFNNETIVIFKDLYNKTSFHSYCHIEDGIFTVSEKNIPDWWEGKGFYPATKEQRDLLFQKMKEAGYVWDSEKKELRKVEQNPTAWSDEDEPNIQNIDSVLFYDRKLPEDTCVKLRNFLKTLKQRIGWKPSEEQISSLRDVIYSLPHQPVLFTLYNDLKKLKGE